MSKTKTLIDAEAWLEQVSDSWMYKNTARKIIAAAPRVEVPCWVSVDEELPDTDRFVLGIVNGKYENITFQNAIQLVEYDGKCWYLDGYPQIDAVNITHWMSLPEGPCNNPSVTEDRDTAMFAKQTRRAACGTVPICTREAKQVHAGAAYKYGNHLHPKTKEWIFEKVGDTVGYA